MAIHARPLHNCPPMRQRAGLSRTATTPRLKHCRKDPAHLGTDGKAEHFIRTALREWAHARSHDSARQRATHLNSWLREYNWHPRHASAGYLTPVSRMPLAVNNVMSLRS